MRSRNFPGRVSVATLPGGPDEINATAGAQRSRLSARIENTQSNPAFIACGGGLEGVLGVKPNLIMQRRSNCCTSVKPGACLI